MIDVIDILAPAFLLSLVLLGIHSYFGLEIIKRGIIFTDLAIGQMAALGTAVSLIIWDTEYYMVSLAFALLGALLIAYATKKVKYLEAFIGLLYAFGVSSVVILLSHSAHGMEKFHELMAADILFTSLNDIHKITVFYAVLGIIIYFSMKKTRGFVKDILFFVTFAVTVTSSVKLAGVLVIFAILISPALIATMLQVKRPVLFAWGIGLVINLAAILVSYFVDVPTGYTLVLLHALVAILVSMIKPTAQEQESG
jgi:zinc/manganese transport system permease protein